MKRLKIKKEEKKKLIEEFEKKYKDIESNIIDKSCAVLAAYINLVTNGFINETEVPFSKFLESPALKHILILNQL